MICDHDVAWPWPCGDVPVMTVTLPVGCMRTVELSQPPGVSPSACLATSEGTNPHTSTQVESPRPSSLPRLAASLRRASKVALSSESSSSLSSVFP